MQAPRKSLLKLHTSPVMKNRVSTVTGDHFFVTGQTEKHSQDTIAIASIVETEYVCACVCVRVCVCVNRGI